MDFTDFLIVTSDCRYTEEDFLEEYTKGLVSFFRTGSREICNPPVLDTDVDYMVFVVDLGQVIIDLSLAGWEVNQILYETSDFVSAYRGEVNLLLTDKIDFFNRFRVATKVAKLLNVTDKTKRIALFEAIKYGRYTYPDSEKEL